MSEQPSGPAGPGSDEWPDDLWPDDDNSGVSGDPWAQSIPPGGPGGMPGAGPGGMPGRPASRRFSPATLVVIAVVAVVAGAGIALGFQVFGSPASSAPPSQSSNLAPLQPGAGGQPGSGGQAGPNGGFPGGAGGVAHAFLIGKVVKVSSTSITIGGPGRSITASVTSSTRVTGKVSAISGIKVGDQVSAQITEGNGSPTVAAIQYPAQMPTGGIPGG